MSQCYWIPRDHVESTRNLTQTHQLGMAADHDLEYCSRCRWHLETWNERLAADNPLSARSFRCLNTFCCYFVVLNISSCGYWNMLPSTCVYVYSVYLRRVYICMGICMCICICIYIYTHIVISIIIVYIILCTLNSTIIIIYTATEDAKFRFLVVQKPKNIIIGSPWS